MEPDAPILSLERPGTLREYKTHLASQMITSPAWHSVVDQVKQFSTRSLDL